MTKSMKVYCMLSFLFHGAKSSYLREGNNGGSASSRYVWQATDSHDEIDRPESSMRRILQRKPKYDIYECSPNIVQLESVVFIEFNTDLTNLTQNERQSLEDAFQATYNNLINSFCDTLYHRSVTSVSLESPPQQRRLGETNSRTEQYQSNFDPGDWANATYFSLDNSSLQSFETVSVGGTISKEEAQNSLTGVARFFVSIECHNCPTNTSLFTEVASASPDTMATSAPARIPAGAQAVESCVCVAESEPGVTAPFRAPTAAEFQVAFNETVGTLRGEGVLQDLEFVEDVVEVDAVNCSSNVQMFETNVIANLEGNIELLTLQERAALEQSFLETYNWLTFAGCDRFFRQILKVQLISTQDRRLLEASMDFYPQNTTNATQLHYNETVAPTYETKVVPAVYRVFGLCRDCQTTDSGTFELFDDGFRRSLISHQWLPVASQHRGRRLVETPSDVCFCPPNVDPGDQQAPSDKEFEQVYNGKLEQLQEEGVVVHVASVESVSTDQVACNQRLREQTGSYVVSFLTVLNNEPGLTSTLEEAFRSAYRTLGRDACGPLLSGVWVKQLNEARTQVVFDVMSLQAFPGSIFLDSLEESAFMDSFNEYMGQNSISEAEGISFATSRVGETSAPRPPSTARPTQKVVPTSAPPDSIRPTLLPTTLSPTSTVPSPTSMVPTERTTLGPTPDLTGSKVFPSVTVPPTTHTPSTNPPSPLPTGDPTSQSEAPPITLPPAGPGRSDQRSSPSPTTQQPQTAEGLDEVIAGIIEDVGDKVEEIVGIAAPVIEGVQEFLDYVDEELGELLNSVLPEIPNLSEMLEDISVKLQQLPEMSSLPDLPQTKEKLQGTIEDILAMLEKGSATTTSPITATPRSTQPSTMSPQPLSTTQPAHPVEPPQTLAPTNSPTGKGAKDKSTGKNGRTASSPTNVPVFVTTSPIAPPSTEPPIKPTGPTISTPDPTNRTTGVTAQPLPEGTQQRDPTALPTVSATASSSNGSLTELPSPPQTTQPSTLSPQPVSTTQSANPVSPPQTLAPTNAQTGKGAKDKSTGKNGRTASSPISAPVVMTTPPVAPPTTEPPIRPTGPPISTQNPTIEMTGVTTQPIPEGAQQNATAGPTVSATTSSSTSSSYTLALTIAPTIPSTNHLTSSATAATPLPNNMPTTAPSTHSEVGTSITGTPTQGTTGRVSFKLPPEAAMETLELPTLFPSTPTPLTTTNTQPTTPSTEATDSPTTASPTVTTPATAIPWSSNSSDTTDTTGSLSDEPSSTPSSAPSNIPSTETPSLEPTVAPTPEPTSEPTPEPTSEPTPSPTTEPTPSSTFVP